MDQGIQILKELALCILKACLYSRLSWVELLQGEK